MRQSQRSAPSLAGFAAHRVGNIFVKQKEKKKKKDVFKTFFSLALKCFFFTKTPIKLLLLSQGTGYFYLQDASEFPVFFFSKPPFLEKNKASLLEKNRLIFSQSILNFHKEKLVLPPPANCQTSRNLCKGGD